MYKKIRFLLQCTIQERYNYLSPTRLILTVCTLPSSDQFLSRVLQRKTLWENWLQKWLPGYTVVQTTLAEKIVRFRKISIPSPPPSTEGTIALDPPPPWNFGVCQTWNSNLVRHTMERIFPSKMLLRYKVQPLYNGHLGDRRKRPL